MATPTDDTPAGQPSNTSPETEAPPKGGFGKQQVIATIITLVVLIIVFARIFPQLGDYDQAWAAIQNMSNTWVAALVVATIAMILIYVFPFQAALPGLSYGNAFMVRQTSFMISNSIPAGGAIGLGVQFGMLDGYGFGPARATAAIGVTSVWNTLVTLTLPVLAALGLVFVGYTNSTATLLAVGGLVVVGVLIGLFALILKSEAMARKLGGYADSLISWAAGLIRKDADTDLAEGAVKFRDSVVGVVRERWGWVTLANFGQQFSQFLILYIALLAIGDGSSEATFIEAFAAFAFAKLATFIPLPPGGLGTVDAAMTAILVAFGVSNNDAMAATLIWRGATFFPQIVIGIVTFLIHRRKRPTVESQAA
jgi:uncharacterized protein (TIRG00374 family)